MLLHKPQVYRHILFNRGHLQNDLVHQINKPVLQQDIPPRNKAFHTLQKAFENLLFFLGDRSLFRLSILLNLIEVYMKWYKQEQDFGLYLDSGHFLVHFLYLFGMSVFENLIFQLTLFFLLRFSQWLLVRPSAAISTPHKAAQALNGGSLEIGSPTVGFEHIYFHTIGKAIIVSSFCKLIITFMVIWDFSDLDNAWLINIFVLTSNTEAIYALCHVKSRRPLLSQDYRFILCLVLCSHLCKYMAQILIHYFVDSTYPIYIF